VFEELPAREGFDGLASRIASESELSAADAELISTLGSATLLKLSSISPLVKRRRQFLFSQHSSSHSQFKVFLRKLDSAPAETSYDGGVTLDLDNLLQAMEGEARYSKLVDSLLKLRAELADSTRPSLICRINCGDPDVQKSEQGPNTLGIDVIRAIVLAALMLPAEISIQLPLSSFGLRFAHVAVLYGITDLGSAAPQQFELVERTFKLHTSGGEMIEVLSC
jgi:hypothetical protein